MSREFKKLEKARVKSQETRSKIDIKEKGRNNEIGIPSPACIPKIEVNKIKIGSWKRSIRYTYLWIAWWDLKFSF